MCLIHFIIFTQSYTKGQMSFCHHIASCHLTPQCKLLKNLLFYKPLGLNSTKVGLNHPLDVTFKIVSKTCITLRQYTLLQETDNKIHNT